MDLVYFLLFRKADTWGSRLARKVNRSFFAFVSYTLQQLTRYIKKRAPRKYHDKLIPKYGMTFYILSTYLLKSHVAPGCKRMILDPGYLICLHQENGMFAFVVGFVSLILF